MSFRRTILWTSVGIFVAAWSGPVLASPIFPPAIKADLMLDYDLGTTHCIICHQSNSGGVGTVVQPFGEAMRRAGLVLEDTDSLKRALDALQADKTDSDCDGVPDVEQLEQGRDPNDGAYIDGSGRTPQPRPSACANAAGGDLPLYGCGAQLGPGSTSGVGVAGALALGLFLGTIRGARRYGGHERQDRRKPP